MPLRLGIARWLPAAAAAVAVGVFAWWYLGTGDPESGTPPATTPTATAPPQPEHVAEAVEGLRSEGGGPAEPDAPDRPPWEVVRTVCPWPPLPSSWQVLDEPCLSAMIRLDDNPVGGAPPGWRNALQNDPLGTRRAVAAALARHDCSMVALADDWPGETRPALREALRGRGDGPACGIAGQVRRKATYGLGDGPCPLPGQGRQNFQQSEGLPSAH